MDNNFIVQDGCAHEFQSNFNNAFDYILAYFVFTANKSDVKLPEQAARKLAKQFNGHCHVERDEGTGTYEFQIEANFCQRVASAQELEAEMSRMRNQASFIFKIAADCPSLHLEVHVHEVQRMSLEAIDRYLRKSRKRSRRLLEKLLK